MKKVLLVTVCLMSGVLLLRAFAQVSQKTEEPAKFHLATPGQPIAGIPHDEALKIYRQHAEELRQLPGAVSVSFTAEGLVVETANPEVLPKNVEGLPVFATPPVDPDAVGALQKGLPRRPSAPQPDPPQVTSEPELPDEPCPQGMHREAPHSRCRYDNPPPEVIDDGGASDLLPPPPGVIVLRPGKVREQADTCPQDFTEVKVYNNWRFCIDPEHPEPIPPLMAPPIAGIPFEKAQAIHLRHIEELGKLPGVDGVGLERVMHFAEETNIRPLK